MPISPDGTQFTEEILSSRSAWVVDVGCLDGGVFVASASTDFEPRTTVAAYTTDGSPLWSKEFTGAYPSSIAVDSDSVWIGAAFPGTVTIENRSLRSVGGTDILLLRLSR